MRTISRRNADTRCWRSNVINSLSDFPRRSVLPHRRKSKHQRNDSTFRNVAEQASLKVNIIRDVPTSSIADICFLRRFWRRREKSCLFHSQTQYSFTNSNLKEKGRKLPWNQYLFFFSFFVVAICCQRTDYKVGWNSGKMQWACEGSI